MMQTGNWDSNRGSFRVVALLAVLALVPLLGAQAQEYDLYATLIKSKGYTVGSKLSQSGLHRFDRDTTWVHFGYNHPHISAISIEPDEPEVIFFAGGNGAFRSLDGGKSWKIVTGWEITELQDIKINPNNHSEIYLAAAYGIWKSTDRGDTWVEAMDGIPKRYVMRLVFDSTTPGRVLAATDGGVYESTGGKSWTALSEDVPVLDLEQSISDPQIWIAATRGKGVLLSSDNGKSWDSARGKSVASKNIYAASIDPHNSRHMAAGGWKTGVLFSTDGGRRWKKVTKGLPTDGFYQVKFDPGHPGRVWVATIEEGVFYSDNDGKRWTYAGMYGTLVFDLEFVRRGASK